MGCVTAKARIEALLDDGVDEPDEALAALVGCAVTTGNTYRQEWQRRHCICGQRLKIPPAAEVDACDLPLETSSGLMWQLPVIAPRSPRAIKGWSSCDVCPLRPQCERALTDPLWYNGCERPLVWEVPQLSSPTTCSSATTEQGIV